MVESLPRKNLFNSFMRRSETNATETDFGRVSAVNRKTFATNGSSDDALTLTFRCRLTITKQLHLDDVQLRKGGFINTLVQRE